MLSAMTQQRSVWDASRSSLKHTNDKVSSASARGARTVGGILERPLGKNVTGDVGIECTTTATNIGEGLFGELASIYSAYSEG